MPIPSNTRKTPKSKPAKKVGTSHSNSDTNIREDLEAWIENVVDDSDENKRVMKQIALGGVSGLVTGFVCMKIGKIAATAIGGGIILLQLANQKGYIKVNWNKVNRDFENVTDKIQKETFGKKKVDWAERLEKKAISLVDKPKNFFQRLVYTEDDRMKDLQYFVTSFTAGIGLGLIFGR